MEVHRPEQALDWLKRAIRDSIRICTRRTSATARRAEPGGTE